MKISDDVKIAIGFVTAITYIGTFLWYTNNAIDNAQETCPLGSQDLWENATSYWCG